jgi:hypothetical protein
MYRTEEEAKKTWCPHRRVAMNAGMAANWSGSMRAGPEQRAYGNIYNDTRCIASECSAWRWRTALQVTDIETVIAEDRSAGFCGLATTPIAAAPPEIAG